MGYTTDRKNLNNDSELVEVEIQRKFKKQQCTGLEKIKNYRQ